jgi:hypothetical protein
MWANKNISEKHVRHIFRELLSGDGSTAGLIPKSLQLQMQATSASTG